ncbi:LysR family transcriptional regulator [Streptomyces olivaceus]|uniref:LysR family transcriptional regulator n=1 Tax=Streptomyces olivaceus TaxID=47716 RepID=UPI001CC9B19A|nr:LysR family transcriptional regulator [Streptomyces olivaceus]MBZ6206678.1 LysR family transcriptional regulator [Streptomyces olivaceus]MBZ6293884.1 LysR family transcriptional regulator [Streptomyces olivaceus]MBZ6329060.1 LysR family transcriptional regulator [Streptomyces olivaceus]
MMKLSQCKAFVAVADTGSFTAAAQLIGVSQSAVSHAVASLEKGLGTELLKREHGRITLTAAGRRVLYSARIMLKHAQEITTVGSLTRSASRTTLRIGVSRSFGKRVLARLLGEFHARHADVALDVRVGKCAQVEEWLRSGFVELGIGGLADSGFSVLPLVSDRMHVVLPVGHPLGAATSVHVRQLAGERLLMSGGDPEARLEAFFREHGVDPLVSLRVDDPVTLMTMTANGYGVSLLPGIALPAKAPRLCALPLVPALPCDQVLAVGRRATANAFTDEFVALVTSSLDRRELVVG